MRILRIIPGRAPTAFFGGTPTACLASWRRWRRQYPSRKESAESAGSAESVVHFLTCVAYPGPFGRYATVPRLLTGSSQVEAQSHGWQLEAQRSRCMAHVSRRNPASYVRIHTETGDARSHSAAEVSAMKLEIWSDIACPWCYVGKRRFEQALASFPERDSLEITWRSFELD